ncbi:FAD-dependent oxidoreductase [Pseudomonas sp. A-RE-19]|nr:FAD-dependent oxidoreductase [Pseudomonas sp. A-RE-19]
MTARYDFIVVGGGIAGVSVAYELAALRRRVMHLCECFPVYLLN